MFEYLVLYKRGAKLIMLSQTDFEFGGTETENIHDRIYVCQVAQPRENKFSRFRFKLSPLSITHD